MIKKLKKWIKFNLLKNQELIYFLLSTIKDCIPEKYLTNYAIQLDCIQNIQWVLDVEVDLRFDKDRYCKSNFIEEWQNEKKIAIVYLTDKKGKKYTLNFFAVGGHIFSIESTLPFRKLDLDDIVDLKVECSK